MNRKWFAALAVLFLVVAACVCESSGGEISNKATEVIEELPTLDISSMGNMLDCAEIKEQFDTLSDSEWENYSRSITGQRIGYEGKISKIDSDGHMLITYACPSITVFTIYGTPNDVLSILTEGQFIMGIGTIRKAEPFLSYLRIEVDGEKVGKAIHSEAEIVGVEKEQTEATIESFFFGTAIVEETQTEPDVYTCDYINDQRKKMTELQWEEYTKSLVGKPIEYEGEITEVYEDGRIQIDACSGILSGGPFVIYGTPIDVAIEFQKNQFIKGKGTIKEVGTFIFMYIHVYGETLE